MASAGAGVLSPSSPSSRPGTAADDASLRISLGALTVQREDSVVEDNFQTWSEVVLLGSDGVPDGQTWYAGEDVNFGRTSVTNGNEASYNYARASKSIARTEAAVSTLVASAVVVRWLAPLPHPPLLATHLLALP